MCVCVCVCVSVCVWGGGGGGGGGGEGRGMEREGDQFIFAQNPYHQNCKVESKLSRITWRQIFNFWL